MEGSHKRKQLNIKSIFVCHPVPQIYGLPHVQILEDNLLGPAHHFLSSLLHSIVYITQPVGCFHLQVVQYFGTDDIFVLFLFVD